MSAAIAHNKRSLDSGVAGSSSSTTTNTNKRYKLNHAPVLKNEIDPETKLSKCFHKVTTKLYISLAPMFLNDPLKGIKKQHLDPLLMTFSSQAKGVILSYSNIKFASTSYDQDESTGQQLLLAPVKYDTAYSFLWISVDFLVWRPLVGDYIEGYSYMQTPSHIGLLLHDTFNANIKKFNIPSSWEFIPNADDEYSEDQQDQDEDNGSGANGEGQKSNVRSLGYWVDENKVKIDGELKFTIKAIHTAGKLVSVEGTLLQPGQENGRGLYSSQNNNGSNNFNDHNNIINNNSNKNTQTGHKKFFDDDFQDTSLTVIPEPVKEDLEDLPKWENNDSEDEKVVAEADSSEDENDDD